MLAVLGPTASAAAKPSAAAGKEGFMEAGPLPTVSMSSGLGLSLATAGTPEGGLSACGSPAISQGAPSQQQQDGSWAAAAGAPRKGVMGIGGLRISLSARTPPVSSPDLAKLVRRGSEPAQREDLATPERGGMHTSTSGFFTRQKNSFVNLVRLTRSSPGGRSLTDCVVVEENAATPQIARISLHSKKGAKHANSVNEDTMLCEPDIFANSDVCDRSVALFGVFDGHGGSACATLAATLMPKYFRECREWEALRGAMPGDVTIVERVLVFALEYAFQKVEEEFEAHAAGANDTSGSCGLVAAVCDGIVVLANVGDSKAVAYIKEGDKQSVRSTARHNIANADEVTRVLAAGGTFVQNRLLGCLLPTRAFGNIDCRQHSPGVLISRPQLQVVRLRPIGAGDAAVLLLATDGLWDILDPTMVVMALKSGLKRQARQLATVDIAESLVIDAIRAGTNDDTSAVCVIFK